MKIATNVVKKAVNAVKSACGMVDTKTLDTITPVVTNKERKERPLSFKKIVSEKLKKLAPNSFRFYYMDPPGGRVGDRPIVVFSLLSKNRKTIEYGFAFCSHKDTYNKNVGRNIALDTVLNKDKSKFYVKLPWIENGPGSLASAFNEIPLEKIPRQYRRLIMVTQVELVDENEYYEDLETEDDDDVLEICCGDCDHCNCDHQ